MEPANNYRDFTSISPSARWMLQWKGYTTIPYAREVATLLAYPDLYEPDYKKRDFTFWASIVGLENRYRTVDQLLNELEIPNILELSSGYSFRSLDFANRKEVHYIDTDLPEVIATKKVFLDHLQNEGANITGKLELLSLNVVDETKFKDIINHFPPGEIVVVNEGLLAYLNQQEREKLCGIIHALLKERGGYWITGDIHLKHVETKLGLQFNEEVRQFNIRQHTDENKFESFREAESFFNRMGFVVDKEGKVKYSEMSGFKNMVKSLTLRRLFKLRNASKIQCTWRLKAV